MVYVISKDNKPLMPCAHAIARLLLKQGKAKVKRKEPFTIKLTYETTEYVQQLTMGVDTGSGTFAVAVANEKDEIVCASEVTVRNDIHEKTTRRSKYRRNRRNRKTRYRKPRFMNRKNSKRSDRFSPTMTSKLQAHVREIEFVKSILPIAKMVFETAKFDTALMANPTMNLSWGYQQGPNYGYSNKRMMVLARDNYTCRYCHGKRKCAQKDVHHIVFKSLGGSDDEENLATACHLCHVDIHDGKISTFLAGPGKMKGTLNFATQMNSICKQLLRIYPDAIETFGFVTSANRFNLNLPKEHYIDAAIIATGGNMPIMKTNVVYVKRCIAKGDYQQSKGVRSEQKLNTKKIAGFRKFDKVKYKGKEYFIKGRMSTGYATLMDINGVTQKFTNPKTVKLSNCKRVSARKSVIIMAKKVA